MIPDDFQSDCIFVISEATSFCIFDECGLDLACPVLVLHFPGWIVVNHAVHNPQTTRLLCENYQTMARMRVNSDSTSE